MFILASEPKPSRGEVMGNAHRSAGGKIIQKMEMEVLIFMGTSSEGKQAGAITATSKK